jgi:two-component system, cell cycle sensor histidine kinase and response regulator CckA
MNTKNELTGTAAHQVKNEMFDIFSEQAMLGIVIIQDYTIQYANTALAEITGFSVEEMCGLGRSEFMQWVHPDDQEYMLVQVKKKLGGNSDFNSRYDWRLITKSGDVRWIAMYSRPTVYQSKTAIFGTMIDITENKRSVQALKENEEKYRFLIDNATDAIFIAQDERVKFLNPESIEMTGYTEEELLTMPFLKLIHPDDQAMVAERYQKRLLGETFESTYSFRVLTKSGKLRWGQLSTALINWQNRPATLNIVRDITQQKQMEEKLLQVQKMESIGTLAGGIAHDFNNILMGIQGRASLMMMEVDESNYHYEHLKSIENLIKDAAQVTRQLLGFAQKGKYQAIPTDMNGIIDSSAEMFGRTRKEIIVKKKFEEKLHPVKVDRRQMEQVLLNLYVNGWQAMPGGGEIYLQTENVELDKAFTIPHGVKPGTYVRVCVTDTGAGMDEETKGKIFDPFFTTRTMGRGTGLGLASAYGIIKNHKGIINVRSEKGIGTTFNIYLPITNKEVPMEKVPGKEVITGSGTILLVDDEEIITEVGKKILEKTGYSVDIANSGLEAVSMIEKKSERFDLVILDIVMPGMGGGEVFDKIKKINPALKVLLASGYSVNGEATEIMNRGCDGFIQKPFDITALSKKTKEILCG